jgi:hypothetical protein
VDDDGLMQVFRGGVVFPIEELSKTLLKLSVTNQTTIKRATLHFNLLSGAVQGGSYDNPILSPGVVPSVLQNIHEWRAVGDANGDDLFAVNNPLVLTVNAGGAKSPLIPWFDPTKQARPKEVLMNKVTYPKTPPIRIPGTPIVKGELLEQGAIAYRMHENGKQPFGQYWVDVTEFVSRSLDLLTMALWPNGPVYNTKTVSFVLAKVDQSIADPDKDVNSVLLSLYGDFKLAVYY